MVRDRDTDICAPGALWQKRGAAHHHHHTSSLGSVPLFCFVFSNVCVILCEAHSVLIIHINELIHPFLLIVLINKCLRLYVSSFVRSVTPSSVRCFPLTDYSSILFIKSLIISKLFKILISI